MISDMENIDNNNKIIIYTNDGGDPTIKVRIEGETVWWTQTQLVELFDFSKVKKCGHHSIQSK